jgi:hypothetical protein
MFVEIRNSEQRQNQERQSRRPRENFWEKNNHRHLIYCLAVKRTTLGPTRQLGIRRNLFDFLNVRTYNHYDGARKFNFIRTL